MGLKKPYNGFVAILSILAQVVISKGHENPLHELAQRQDAGITSCISFVELLQSCTSATPNFTRLPFSVEASCLCYSGCAWEPSIYDGAWASCLAYYSTASPGHYSSITGQSLPTDPCQQAGNVAPSTSGNCPTMTSSAQITGSAACVSFDLIRESCELATTSFAELSLSVQASCLCYTSNKFAPSIFDGYWGSCLAYYSTASPAYYSAQGGDILTGAVCASVGDVRRSTGPTTARSGPTSPTVAPTTTGAPTSTDLTTVISVTSKAEGISRYLINPFASLMILLNFFWWLL